MAYGMQLVIGVLLIIALLVVADITTPPSPETVERGQNVTLICISDDASDVILWMSPQDVVIFDSASDTVLDPDKYERTETGSDYSIMVKDVDWIDAGPYGCQTTGVGGEEYAAQLVVLEQPDPLVSDTIHEYKDVVLACQLSYAGEIAANIDPGHVPELESFIGDARQGEYNETRVENGYCVSIQACDTDFTASSLVQEFHYRGDIFDNGKDFRCRAYTQDPQFDIENSMVLSIQYPPRNIVIDPLEDVYYVGEHINCTADGEPQPDILWSLVNGSFGSVVYGQTLDITSYMVGDNTWMCSAENYVSEERITEHISFEVIGDGVSGGCRLAAASFSIATAIVHLCRYGNWMEWDKAKIELIRLAGQSICSNVF